MGGSRAERAAALKQAELAALAQIAAEQAQATALHQAASQQAQHDADLQTARAREQILAQREQTATAHAAEQAELDRLWERLLAGDPDVVLGRLAEAFEDNDASAAPLGVQGNDVSLVVVVPSPQALPDSRPATSSAGNAVTKKLTAQERTDLYKEVVAGYVIATVREAFAVAPSLESARIVAVRDPGRDVYGQRRVEAVLAGRFARPDLIGVRCSTVSATEVFNQVASDKTVEQTGPKRAFAALKLEEEPDIAAVVQAIDLEELLS